MPRKAAQKASLKIAEQANEDTMDSTAGDATTDLSNRMHTRRTRRALAEKASQVQPLTIVNTEGTKRKGPSSVDSDSYQPSSKKLLMSPNTSLDQSENEEGPINPKKKEAQPEMSDYEKEILKNIEERKKLFQMIVGEAKAELMQSLASCVEVPKRKPIGRPRGKTKPHFNLNQRKGQNETDFAARSTMSLRPRGKTVKYTSKDDSQSDLEVTGEDDEFFGESAPLMAKEGEFEKLSEDLQDFLKPIQSFGVKEGDIVTVGKSRIQSLAWHPTSSEILLAAGDFVGNIGFWKDGNQESPRQSLVHSRSVNCLTFDTHNPVRLWSSSSDGYLRCTDVESMQVREVSYFTNPVGKTRKVTYHAQKDASTLIVTEGIGAVFLIDVRTMSGVTQNSIQCFDKGASTVSLHPQNEHLFVTCNRYGNAGIFDLRSTKKNEQGIAVPVVELSELSSGVNSAFFSPLTGNNVLTTNADGCLLVYDVATKTEAKLLRNIENDCGSYGGTFKAVWHPQREDIFICGSADDRTKIELYLATTGQVLNYFTDYQLKTNSHLNVFHPTQHLLAAANSCGRVHIFRS